MTAVWSKFSFSYQEGWLMGHVIKVLLPFEHYNSFLPPKNIKTSMKQKLKNWEPKERLPFFSTSVLIPNSQIFFNNWARKEKHLSESKRHEWEFINNCGHNLRYLQIWDLWKVSWSFVSYPHDITIMIVVNIFFINSDD